MMHGNLIPQNVVVTGLGNWKLMGFNFCCFSQYQSDAQVRLSLCAVDLCVCVCVCVCVGGGGGAKWYGS